MKVSSIDEPSQSSRLIYFLPNHPETVPLASAAFCSTVRSALSIPSLSFSRASRRSSSSLSLPSCAVSGMRSSSLYLERALSIYRV